MPKSKINFNKNNETFNDESSQQVDLQNNQNLLLELFGSKLVYSINETAKILNLSYDFVRKQIKMGKITAIHLGDRPMVHIDEVSKLLTTGI